MLDREHEAHARRLCRSGDCLPALAAHLPAVSETRAEIPAGAAELGATAAQVSPAWLLGRSPVVLPIPGTGTIDHLEENVAAASLRLSGDQWRQLGWIQPR